MRKVRWFCVMSDNFFTPALWMPDPAVRIRERRPVRVARVLGQGQEPPVRGGFGKQGLGRADAAGELGCAAGSDVAGAHPDEMRG